MKTIVLKGNANQKFRLDAGESRVIVFLASELVNADIRAVVAERARLRMIFLFVGTGDDKISARLSVHHEGAGSADIVPTLEISAPDAERVCHAAAIARLSDEERFYLESRGLSPAEAVRAAAQGFLSAPFSCAIEIPREFKNFIQKYEHASE